MQHTSFDRTKSLERLNGVADWWRCHKCSLLNDKDSNTCFRCQTEISKHSTRYQSKEMDTNKHKRANRLYRLNEEGHWWRCYDCTYLNHKESKFCMRCHTEIDINPTWYESKEINTNKQEKGKKDWHCSHCTYLNEEGQEICIVCQIGTNPLKSSIRNKIDIIKSDINLHIYVFSFMVSDFYIRTMPLICLMSLIPCDKSEGICLSRMIVFCILFGSLLIFEFVMNKKMRIKDASYSSWLFVFHTFSVSLFSAFYNLLCTLTILEGDIFYGKSVIKNHFIIEHAIRILISMVVSGANMWSLYFNSERLSVMGPLFGTYVIMLCVNIILIKSNKFFRCNRLC